MKKDKPAKVLEGVMLKTKTTKGDCMRYVMTIYEDGGVFIVKYIYSNRKELKDFKEEWSRYGKTLYSESMGFKGKDFISLYGAFLGMYKKNNEKLNSYDKILENNGDNK